MRHRKPTNLAATPVPMLGMKCQKLKDMSRPYMLHNEEARSKCSTKVAVLQHPSPVLGRPPEHLAARA